MEKAQRPALGVELGLQQAVDRGGFPASAFTEPLGSPPRRRSQQRGQLHLVKQRQNAGHGGGFAGAGTAGDDHDPLLRRRPDGLQLILGIFDVRLLLDFPEHPLQAGGRLRRIAGHIQNPLADCSLRLVQLRNIAGVQPRHRIADQTVHVRQAGDTSLNGLHLQVQQRRRGGSQLVPGNKRMTVGLVEGQLEQDAGFHPALVVGLHPQLQGKNIHHSKISAEIGVCQHIGVVLQGVHSQLAVGPVQPHGQLRREPVGRQELNETPHTDLFPEAFGDFPGLGQGDSRHLGQGFRLVFNDLQAPFAEGHDNPGGSFFTHAFHCPGGQIGQDLIPGLRHEPLQQIRLKLAAIGGMGGPAAGDGQTFSHHRHGDGSHHRHHLPILRLQPQNGVPVFLILKDDRCYGPVEHFLFHRIRLHFHS